MVYQVGPFTEPQDASGSSGPSQVLGPQSWAQSSCGHQLVDVY